MYEKVLKLSALYHARIPAVDFYYNLLGILTNLKTTNEDCVTITVIKILYLRFGITLRRNENFNIANSI